jgi:hypothetical protein
MIGFLGKSQLSKLIKTVVPCGFATSVSASKQTATVSYSILLENFSEWWQSISVLKQVTQETSNSDRSGTVMTSSPLEFSEYKQSDPESVYDYLDCSISDVFQQRNPIYKHIMQTDITNVGSSK